MPELFDTLHARFSSTEELRQELHEFLKRKQSSARGALVVAENKAEDPVAVMKRRLKNCEVIWQSGAGTMIRLSRRFVENGNPVTISGKILVLPTSHPQIFLAVTIDVPKFASHVMRRLIDRCSPRIFLPRITSSAVAGVLQRAAGSKDAKYFVITDVIARSRMEHKRGKRYRAERMRTGESIDELLNLLQEREQWLHAAAFNYALGTGTYHSRCSGRVSRECSFIVFGEFAWFHRNVIELVKDEAILALKFFSKRARKDTKDNEPRPIVIEYPDAVFADKSKNLRLLQTLRRLNKVSVSTLHANPYFRSSVVDFTDGSSYDIWVLSQSRIIVTPQFRATSASMERLIDHILTDFGEGEVKDFGEVFDAG